MSSIRAVIVDPSVPERLIIREVSYPTALSSEALVRVKAISLNRGVHTALSAEEGWRPGWDLAGLVDKAAAYSEDLSTRVLNSVLTEMTLRDSQKQHALLDTSPYDAQIRVVSPK